MSLATTYASYAAYPLTSHSRFARPPSFAKIGSGFGPRRKFECEAALHEVARNNTAALEHQFAFGAEKKGTNL
jgi:hypothetical protein